jgi:hypothetical protein
MAKLAVARRRAHASGGIALPHRGDAARHARTLGQAAEAGTDYSHVNVLDLNPRHARILRAIFDLLTTTRLSRDVIGCLVWRSACIGRATARHHHQSVRSSAQALPSTSPWLKPVLTDRATCADFAARPLVGGSEHAVISCGARSLSSHRRRKRRHPPAPAPGRQHKRGHAARDRGRRREACVRPVSTRPRKRACGHSAETCFSPNPGLARSRAASPGCLCRVGAASAA